MRLRLGLPLAALAAGALVIVPVIPAAAATTTWTSSGDSAWTTAVWATAVPAAGDDVTFAGGVRSTYDLGNVALSSLRFTNEHRVANGGGIIGLTSGIIVDAAGAATIEPGIATAGSQAWTIASGGSLTLPSQVDVDPASTLTLTVDGQLIVTTGNLDGGAAACIRAGGAGELRFEGGGGGVGACPGSPQGIVASAASTTFPAGAFLGGTDFVAAGGVLSGGSLASPSTVRSLSLISGGTVNPGGSLGAGLGELDLWGTSTWAGGTYAADVDAAAGSDLVFGVNQAIILNATVLQPRLTGTATPGQTWTVLGSDVGVSGQFSSPAGSLLADGAEFESVGQIFSIDYQALGVSVSWLRAAPVVIPPVLTAPAATAQLALSGSEGTVPAALLALVAMLTGALIVLSQKQVKE